MRKSQADRTLAGTVTVASFSCLTGWANEDSGHNRPSYICLNRKRKSNTEGFNGSHSICYRAIAVKTASPTHRLSGAMMSVFLQQRRVEFPRSLLYEGIVQRSERAFSCVREEQTELETELYRWRPMLKIPSCRPQRGPTFPQAVAL